MFMIRIFLISTLFIAVMLAGCSDDGNAEIKDGIYYFYSPKCPHCENVKPYVEEASKKTEITLCQVENMDDACKAVAEKIGLKGVPTAVKIERGKQKIYVGENEVKNLMLELIE
jgi:thiol-disulfide isomerase/thioredoxin